MSVPHRFVNVAPPLTDTDLDANKFNENFDSLSDGSGINDKAIKSRHIDETSLLGTVYIDQFIISDDLDNPPQDLGLGRGAIVAVNDISQEGGQIFEVITNDSGLLVYSLFKNRILNMQVIDSSTTKQYRLILDEVNEYVWSVSPFLNDQIVTTENILSAAKTVELIGSTGNAIPYSEEFVTVSGQMSYTLSYIPISAYPVRAELNGIGWSINISGTTLTLITLPPAVDSLPAGWSINVYYSIIATTEFTLLKDPSTSASSGTGDVSWVNTNNIYLSDDSKANAGLVPGGGSSEILEATGFGFNLDSIAIIQGIEVTVERVCDADGVAKDDTIKLMKAGLPVGDNKANINNWSTVSDEVITYGGSTDLWGTTWTPAEINHADFGLALIAFLSKTGTGIDAYVDHVSIKVYYKFGES